MKTIKKPLNKSQEFLAFVGVKEAASFYDKMVKALDVIPTSKAPRGLEDLVDLIAQTLNGGFEQYISNDYLDQLPTAMSFLKQLGSVSKEAAALLAKLSDDALEFKDVLDGEYSEDEYEYAAKRLEAWDNWLYANDRDEKIAKEVLDYLTKNKLIPAEEAVTRRLAASSDKAKFQGLKKQILDLEKQKLDIRGQIAALVGKDEPDKYHALVDKRTAILDKIKKLEDEKRKMHNQFRGLSSK